MYSGLKTDESGVTIVEMLIASVLFASVIVLVFSVVTYSKVLINNSSDSGNAATQSITQIELLKQYRSNSSVSEWSNLRNMAAAGGICFDPFDPAEVLAASQSGCFGSLRSAPSRVIIERTDPDLFTATTYWSGSSAIGLKVAIDVDGDGADDNANLVQYRLVLP